MRRGRWEGGGSEEGGGGLEMRRRGKGETNAKRLMGKD